MLKQNKINEIIDYINSDETNNFEYDNAAISDEIAKNNSYKSSLSINIFSIFGGIFAVGAFAGFIFISGVLDSEISKLTFGIILIGLTIFINFKFNTLAIDSTSILLYLSGFILTGMGLAGFKIDGNTGCLIFILISIITLSLRQNFILALFAVLILNGSILALLTINNNYDLVHLYISFLTILLTYIYFNEPTFLKFSKFTAKIYKPLKTGLLLSYIASLVYVGVDGLVKINTDYKWISSVVTILSVLYVISVILNKINVSGRNERIIVFSLSAVILILTSFSPAISGSLLILLLAFMFNNKTDFAIGVLAFIYFISQYYYDLGYTLLIKSGIMFFSGILFIIFFLITNKKLSENEKIQIDNNNS